MPLPVLALLLQLGLASVPVNGTLRCPTVEQIAARLQDIQGVENRGSLVASVEEREEGLVVSLRTAGGDLLVERHLTSTAPCEDRAAAVAVIIATSAIQL